jgi:hypothetical protein
VSVCVCVCVCVCVSVCVSVCEITNIPLFVTKKYTSHKQNNTKGKQIY